MRATSRLHISSARWLAYATASAATAVTLGEPSAEGAIHYSGRIDAKLPANKDAHVTFQLDKPGDSIFFERVSATHFSETAGLAGFKAVGLRSGFFVGTGPSVSTYCFVYNLQKGYNVSHARRFGMGADYRSGFGKLAFLGPGSGSFDFRGTYFLGFAFNNGSGRQYGWARVHMRGPVKKNSFRVLDFAYADVGETILVGQTSDSTSRAENGATESLGALAFGAAGLMAWRQRRAAAEIK